MLNVLKLLLPALIPSWRFFDVIGPSPRIQYVILNAKHDEPSEWREFRPLPVRVSFMQMLGRMLWNRRRNESLFMVSCAERLLQHATPHSENEILKRIKAELTVAGVCPVTEGFLQFRLLEVRRVGRQLEQDLVFTSCIKPIAGLGDDT